MIMLSVLRSDGRHKDLFNYFEDFDAWSYDAYVDSCYSSEGSSTGVGFFQENTRYEIAGGYLVVLRGVKTNDIYTGTKFEPPLFDGINENAFCHLIGKTQANLFAGIFAERNTYHLIGEEKALIPGLQQVLTDYLKKSENPTGTVRDLNACLKYFGKAVF